MFVPLRKIFCLLLFLYLSLQLIQAQTAPPPKESKNSQEVFLLGNLCKAKIEDPTITELDQMLQKSAKKPAVLILGDVVGNEGFDTQNPKAQMDRLELLKKWSQYSDLYVIGGDRDWDNSKENGLTKVRRLEQYIEKDLELKKIFLPSRGCPGPKVVEINDKITLITVNSQWFMHPYDRPEAPDTYCKILSEGDFWDELEEAIDEAAGKNVIIAAHHPVYSEGEYAGKRLGQYHLIPLFGTLYASFRQQIGTPADMANDRYQIYINHMRDLLSNYNSIVYVSGHEQDLQASKIHQNYHINSGAIGGGKDLGNSDNLVLRNNKKGFLQLDYSEDGAVALEVYNASNNKLVQDRTIPLYQSYCNEDIDPELPINTAYIPCDMKMPPWKKDEPSSFVQPENLVTMPASTDYAATKFRIWSMGLGYREEWLIPITAPYINLKTAKGGLTPSGRGGGLQTHSVKFQNPDGLEYAFRAVDKDPVKALDQATSQTFYRHIVKDLITTQHPYGGLVASRLMDSTDILHSQPELYVMPDDPALGIYREDFAGMMGTLEFRPKKKNQGEKGFEDADLIHSSHKMFRAMYKDHDNRIDNQSFARARVFDMLLGDWDRHEDNWKWAGFKEGRGISYRPIPRDRDHVFSQWEGLIPSIADKVVPNAEHFDYQFGSITSLGFQGRWVDRQLATDISEEEWIEAAKYIQSKMTDQLIDDAVNELPKEVRPIHGQEIADKIKSRRKDLHEAASTLYTQLAEQVDVVGSNKREIFEITRNADGGILVQMYDYDKATGGKGILLYDRLCKPGETKEIHLFGLAGDDQFLIKGSGTKGPVLRIIGGRGNDKIEDQSEAHGTVNQVFDSNEEDTINGGPNTKVKRPKHEARYNNHAFEYNFFSPLPKFRISSGNGFGAELQLTYLRKGFNKPEFKSKFQGRIIYYPGIKAQRIDLKNYYRHVVGLHDIRLHLRISSLYDKFPFFYGIGNESNRNRTLVDQDYYRMDYNTVIFNAGLDRKFLRQSRYRIGLQYEYNNIKPINSTNNIFQVPIYQNLNGLGTQHLVGTTLDFNLDFRDNPHFSKRGSQLFLYNEVFTNQNRGGEVFGKLEGFFANYQSVNIGRPVTLALRGGFSKTYGPTPFNHLSALGSNAYMRAFVRNRFLGRTAAYFNSELRLSGGTIRTPLVPLKWGLFGFYDIGRVWTDNFETGSTLHRGYGGGLYLAPLKEELSFLFSFGYSEDKEFYFSLGTGFDIQ